MKNKISLIKTIISKILKGFILFLVIVLIFRMHGMIIDEVFIKNMHKYYFLDVLFYLCVAYCVIQFIYFIYLEFYETLFIHNLGKKQNQQLEQVEDKVIFESGIYEVFVEIQKYKQYLTSVISFKVRIKENETIKGLLMTIYSKKDCDYLVVNIVSSRKIADLNEIELPNTLNNLQEKENI